MAETKKKKSVVSDEKEQLTDEGRIRTSALKTVINERLRKGTVKNKLK